MTVEPITAAVRCGPGASGVDGERWREVLAPLAASTDGTVTLARGWNPEWERIQWAESVTAGREHVSVRFGQDEVLVGPRWTPGGDAGCAGCAEFRERSVLDHPLLEMRETVVARPAPVAPALLTALDAVVGSLAERPLRPAELYAVGVRGVRRHRIRRTVYCPLCGGAAADPPSPLRLQNHPSSATDPTRAASGASLVTPGLLRERLFDERFGPVIATERTLDVPFAMTTVAVPDSAAYGFGRGATAAETEPIAILEAYERLGGFPFEAPIVTGRTYADVAEHALDPDTLGRYTERQLSDPRCKVMRRTPDSPLDWVWGHDLDDGRPTLVPAEIGFFLYEYRFRRLRRTARRAGPDVRLKYFDDSSSGCAVGSVLEEAAVQSLFELAERDAFLLSWHRAQPLPAVDPATLTDPETRELVDLIRSRGFDVHVLIATQDIALPVVWVLAVRRSGAYAASFSSAGSSANPEAAVRAPMREIAQLVSRPLDEARRPELEAMADNPWLVTELVDHPMLNALPRSLPRVTACLGGPTVRLDEYFPGWPRKLRAAGGVRGVLDHVRGLYADAGLDRIVLVDQTTREHEFAGVRAARAVVPGIVPMCFGHAQQRLAGLPRLTAALAGTPAADRPLPLDPHPFP